MVRNIIAVLVLVLAGGIFYFYTRPAYDSIQAAQVRITQYNSELDQVAQMQKLAADLSTQYSSFNPNDVSRLQKLLPDHVDNIALILDLDKMAAHWGMSLRNVDVSAPPPSNTSGTINSAAGQEKYDALTLKFSTKGTYSNFTKLLTDLEQSLRVVDLVGLSLSNTGEYTGASPVYQFNIVLRTYWLK